jgi:hypothetical protein
MHTCHDAAMPLLQPHVREHNWRRLTRVFDAYGAEVPKTTRIAAVL